MTMPAESVADTPFAVACPGCHGALAVTLGLANTAACCPLCACGFLVPDPRQPQQAAAPTKRRESRQRASRDAVEQRPGASRRDLEIPSQQPAADSTAPPSAATFSAPAAPADVGAAAAVPTGGMLPGSPTAAGEYQFREAGPAIVGSGADAIELRRLSPEEKQARRVRRNLIMLFVGAAILIVFTFLFGRASGKRRRSR